MSDSDLVGKLMIQRQALLWPTAIALGVLMVAVVIGMLGADIASQVAWCCAVFAAVRSLWGIVAWERIELTIGLVTHWQALHGPDDQVAKFNELAEHINDATEHLNLVMGAVADHAQRLDLLEFALVEVEARSEARATALLDRALSRNNFIGY